MNRKNGKPPCVLRTHKAARAGRRIANLMSPRLHCTTLETRMEGQTVKIFDILPQGEEHALSGSEIDHLLGITPRERRAQASRELAQGLMTLYTSEPPGGYFRPSDGEKGRAEIKRFREREAARARAITEKVRAADAVLKQCDGQTLLEPPVEI